MGFPAYQDNDDLIRHHLHLLAIQTMGSSGNEIPSQINEKNLSQSVREISQNDDVLLEDFAINNNVKLITNNPNYECIIVTPFNDKYGDIYSNNQSKASARQMRCARVLLGLSVEKVSLQTEVSEVVIEKLESQGFIKPSSKEEYLNQIKLLKFYIAKGLHFFPPNPIKKQGEAIALSKNNDIKIEIDKERKQLKLPKKEISQQVRKSLGLVKKENKDSLNSVVSNGLQSPLTSFHFKIANAFLTKDEYFLNKYPKANLKKLEQSLDSWTSNDVQLLVDDCLNKGVVFVPASMVGERVLHGEGAYVIDSNSDDFRIIKSIEFAAMISGISLKELGVRTKLNKDLIDIWLSNYQDDKQKYKYLMSFINSDDVYRIIEFLKTKNLHVFISYRSKQVIGLFFTSPKGMYPVNISDEDSCWMINRDTLIKVFKKTSIVVNPNMSVMDSYQFKAGVALLKIDHDKISNISKDVDLPKFTQFPVDLLNKDKNAIDQWSFSNKKEWNDLQRDFVNNGLLFIDNKHCKGVVLEHSSFEWMQSKLSNCLINYLQINAAQSLLGLNDIDLAHQSGISIDDLISIKNIKSGISISSSFTRKIVNYFIENHISFISPSLNHGEGVVLHGDFEEKPYTLSMKKKNYSLTTEDSSFIKQEKAISDEELDNKINGNKIYQFPKQLFSEEENNKEKYIHGRVYFMARKLCHVSKHDLMDRFGHKYYFLKNLEEFENIDISKKNMKDMFNYFSEKRTGIVISDYPNALGSIFLPAETGTLDSLKEELANILQEGIIEEVNSANIKEKDLAAMKKSIYENIINRENVTIDVEKTGYTIVIKEMP